MVLDQAEIVQVDVPSWRFSAPVLILHGDQHGLKKDSYYLVKTLQPSDRHSAFEPDEKMPFWVAEGQTKD